MVLVVSMEYSTIAESGTYPNFTDTTIASGYCYQYQYLVSDNAVNQATYTSSNTVKVDTSLQRQDLLY